MEHIIYADNAATTPMATEVLDVMMPYLTNTFGNPSSLHSVGQIAKKALFDARLTVANSIGAKNADEIIFTSGGTEANNLAIKGFMFGKSRKGTHIITTKIEHPAVLATCKFLEMCDFSVTYLDVDKDGLVSAKDVESAITPNTAMVSIMTANNEIGTVMPIKEIGAVCKKNGVIFHTDAVQAVGHMHIDVSEMNVDMLSISAHKINGPKGSGVLYCRKGLHLEPIIHGGGQEKKRRSGTENMANIVGTAKAVEMSTQNIDATISHTKSLTDRLYEGLMAIPYTHKTGHDTNRLPGTCSVVFEAIEGETLLMFLDHFKIACSTGSACASNSLDPSHVLMAIGLPHEIAHGSLRLSLGHQNTMEEVEYIIEKVGVSVARAREMSPIWSDMMKGK